MTNNLLKRREEALFAFISRIEIPVTTKECIDYLSQSGEISYQSNNRGSVLSSVFALLSNIEAQGTIKRYKKAGTRDTVWYSENHLNTSNSTTASPMRKFLFDNYEMACEKTTTVLMTKMEKDENILKYINSIGDRKDALAMVRADMARISLIKSLNTTSPAVTNTVEVNVETDEPARTYTNQAGIGRS